MIEIRCNDELYTYDAYHITKAFFPALKVVQTIVPDAPFAVKIILPDGKVLSVMEQEAGHILERNARKHYVDKALYCGLKEAANRSLQWGILTGVRPAKIAMKKLEEEFEEEQFIGWFKESYLVSEEKARLAWGIAVREKKLLEKLDCADGYSLYVGIPFCPSVCTYCSFSSGSLKDWKDKVDDYLDALIKELVYIGRVSKKKRLNTIYIGGGTPTTLSASQMERLLMCIDENFSREYLLEYTVEAGRPDSITREKLKVLYAHKVTRISVNPQTMQQKTLDLIGRGHTVKEVASAFYMARTVGFDNINMDLIAGLPGEGIREMGDTLEQIERLSPDSLTVHSLAIKRAALMGQANGIKEYTQAVDAGSKRMAEELPRMIKMARESAARLGLLPYYLYRQKNIAGNFENVGYAKVDKAGIYNILIMEEKQSIIAAGAGASTKIVLKEQMAVPGSKKNKMTNLVRVENVKAIDAYIGRIDEMIERKGEWLWR